MLTSFGNRSLLSLPHCGFGFEMRLRGHVGQPPAQSWPFGPSAMHDDFRSGRTGKRVSLRNCFEMVHRRDDCFRTDPERKRQSLKFVRRLEANILRCKETNRL